MHESKLLDLTFGHENEERERWPCFTFIADGICGVLREGRVIDDECRADLSKAPGDEDVVETFAGGVLGKERARVFLERSRRLRAWLRNGTKSPEGPEFLEPHQCVEIP
ncbi:hypothetical protein ACFX13_036310 [Malus domestica]